MRVQCAGEGCKKSVDIPEQSVGIKYACADHTTADSNAAVLFQNYAFDPKLGSGKSQREFRGVITNFDGPKGFQIIEGMPDREVPKWAYLKKDIQKILLLAFPKLETNSNQRQKAGRWAQIIKLYYLQGASAQEVADELGESPAVITRLLLSIKRVSKGLTVNGCQRKR